MSDTNRDVLDFLRVQFARLHERHDRTESKITDLIQRVGQLEVSQAGLHRDNAGLNETVAHMSVRLDNVAARLDRIERRPDLVDAPS
jgi:uncharacterized protein YigA (DUF484 family)